MLTDTLQLERVCTWFAKLKKKKKRAIHMIPNKWEKRLFSLFPFLFRFHIKKGH